MKCWRRRHCSTVASSNCGKLFVESYTVSERHESWNGWVMGQQVCNMFDADPTFDFFCQNCLYTELAC